MPFCCWGKEKSKDNHAASDVGIHAGANGSSSAPHRQERPTSSGQVYPQLVEHDIHESCRKNEEARDAKVEELNDTIDDLHKQIRRSERNVSSSGDVISIQVTEIQELKEANDSLKTRISTMASANLTDGNPNIADLSDENRPSKIAEKFSELYDNEWTDAFDALTADNKRSDEDAILTLLKLLCDVYNTCNEKATTDLNEMTLKMKEFQGGLNPSKEILKQLKDQRKRKVRSHMHALKADVKVRVRTLLSDGKERKEQRMKMFLKKCLELCWLMAIQDPQVYIDTTIKRSGEVHDSNTLRSYTKSGKFIDYIVWPALYLYENGNLMSKGVAQCKTEISKAACSDSEQHIDNIEAEDSAAVTNTSGTVAHKPEHYSDRRQGSTEMSDVVDTDTKQPTKYIVKVQQDKNVEAIADISEVEAKKEMRSTVNNPEKEQPKTDITNAEAKQSESETTLVTCFYSDNNNDNSPLSASKSIIIQVEYTEESSDSVSDSTNVKRISNTNSEQLCSNPAPDGEHTDVLNGTVAKPKKKKKKEKKGKLANLSVEKAK